MTRTLERDIVIIGSGAGGGTVADRLSKLCAKGVRVTLLDAGPWHRRETYTMLEHEMTKLYKNNGAVPSKNLDITVAAGECVGGGTAMYTGVTFRAPEGLIAKWARDYGMDDLDETDIQSRFPALEEAINAHYPGRDMENANNRLFREGCEKLGWPVKQFRVNIKDCEKCGFCNLGCPWGSKRGTNEVQIPNAVDNGVEVIPNCSIRRVGDGFAEGVIAAAPEGTRPGPHEPGEVRLQAKTIVLAGGTLGTPPLLLNSGIGDLSPICGKFVTLHPAMMSFGMMNEEVAGFEGFPKLYYTEQFSDSDHFYIETAFYFPFVTAKSLPGFGAGLRRFMRGYRRMTCALTLVHDEAEERNRMTVKGGRPVLDYSLSEQSIQSLVRAQREVGRICFAAGAKEYTSPVSDGTFVEREADIEKNVHRGAYVNGKVVANSGHPMGGCRMGADPACSVVDSWGRVHGHPSLYVADSSLFPTSVKVNPYLTIMAFADRIAEKIEKDFQ